jgi:ribosome production factor 1
MREYDPSFLTTEPGSSNDQQQQFEEQVNDIASDPFASYFTSAEDPNIPPKVLITTSFQASKATYDFCDELVGVFPGAEFIRRKKGKGFEMGMIASWAGARGYKHLIVVNEDVKKPSTLCEIFSCALNINVMSRCYHHGLFAKRTICILQADVY